MSRAKKILIALVAVVALAIGAVYAYILWIRDDAPPALTTADLDEALAADSTWPPIRPTVDSDDARCRNQRHRRRPCRPRSPDGTATSGDPSGTWNISTDSTLGYRVSEVLFGVDTEGAGRTNAGDRHAGHRRQPPRRRPSSPSDGHDHQRRRSP